MAVGPQIGNALLMQPEQVRHGLGPAQRIVAALVEREGDGALVSDGSNHFKTTFWTFCCSQPLSKSGVVELTD